MTLRPAPFPTRTMVLTGTSPVDTGAAARKVAIPVKRA